MPEVVGTRGARRRARCRAFSPPPKGHVACIGHPVCAAPRCAPSGRSCRSGARRVAARAPRRVDHVRVERARQALVGLISTMPAGAPRPARLHERMVDRADGADQILQHLRIASAYGRACFRAASARRIFAAATCFIALVICCVFFSDRIRSRRSRTVGIYENLEALVELLDRRDQRFVRVVGELLRVCAIALRISGCFSRSEAEEAGRPLCRRGVGMSVR